jgi:hypothetical protein
MPVALRQSGLRYYFFSNEGQPPEVATQKCGWNRKYRWPIVMASIPGNFRISCRSSRTIATCF